MLWSVSELHLWGIGKFKACNSGGGRGVSRDPSSKSEERGSPPPTGGDSKKTVIPVLGRRRRPVGLVGGQPVARVGAADPVCEAHANRRSLVPPFPL